MKKLICFLVVPNMLGACGAANASIADSSNDVHCSVIADHLSRIADADAHATAKQRQALALTRDWYLAKVRERVAKGATQAEIMAEANPVIEASNRNPGGMSEVAQRCGQRASQDPAFKRVLAETWQ